MAFPTNPTDGQTANVNGITYTYSTSLTAWQVTTAFSGNVSVDQLNSTTVVTTNMNSSTVTATSVTVSGNIASGNLTIGGSVTGNLTVTGNTISPFYTSSRTISSSTTIGNTNAMSPGPITIADGVTVTVASGGEWSIV